MDDAKSDGGEVLFANYVSDSSSDEDYDFKIEEKKENTPPHECIWSRFTKTAQQSFRTTR